RFPLFFLGRLLQNEFEQRLAVNADSSPGCCVAVDRPHTQAAASGTGGGWRAGINFYSIGNHMSCHSAKVSGGYLKARETVFAHVIETTFGLAAVSNLNRPAGRAA